jgi:polyhydroxyalkanoate synthesis regulator phasin
MFDLIKKMAYTGLGLAFMTKEKVEELSKEMVERGKLSEAEGKEFIDELEKKSEEARKKVEKQIHDAVKDALKKMNIPTRDDVLKLEKQIEELTKSIKKSKPEGLNV